MRTRLIAVGICVATLVAGCGDDDGSTDVGQSDVGDPGSGGETAEDAADELDVATALAGLQTVHADAESQRTDDYPALELDECPLGDQHEIAQTVTEVAHVFEGTTHDASPYAHANFEHAATIGCDIVPFVDAGEPEGAAEVAVRVVELEAGGYDERFPPEGRGRGGGWTVHDETTETHRGGELVQFCWRDEGGSFDDDCAAHWYDEEVGIVFELELTGSGEGSVNAADTGAALELLLADLVSALTAHADT